MGFILSDKHRGFPSGERAVLASEIAQKNWSPVDGKMNLPCLSMDLDTYRDNRAALFGICKAFDIGIAPHIKTPMAPVLASGLVESGAWAISVADLRQAAVMIERGVSKILIANEIGGANTARRLAALARKYPRAEIWLFVDSPSFIDALADLWANDASLPDIRLLVDVGCGRGGVRSQAAVIGIIDSIRKAKRGLILSGVATYEGTLNGPDMNEVVRNLDELFARCRDALREVRAYAGRDAKLIFTAGGSTLFDHVIVRSLPLLANDTNTRLVLRCGALFFSDHGPIRKRIVALGQRDLLGPECRAIVERSFLPALRLWGEVLSVQGENLAICGLGLRDVAHDQGLPTPLAVWRDGQLLRGLAVDSVVAKLNDQHAFVQLANPGVQAGDVVEFGVSHPCTTIDKHSVIYALDKNRIVVDAFETFFG